MNHLSGHLIIRGIIFVVKIIVLNVGNFWGGDCLPSDNCPLQMMLLK